jgi:hypothetical protein
VGPQNTPSEEILKGIFVLLARQGAKTRRGGQAQSFNSLAAYFQ